MEPPIRAEALHILREGHWFADVPPELQETIVDASLITAYPQGELILQQDAPPQGLFAVLEGQVAVTRWVDSDREVLIHIGGPGMWFGELALLASTNTTVMVTAHTDVRVLYLAPEGFERLIEEEPTRYRWFSILALERYAIFLRLTADIRGYAPSDRLRNRLADIIRMRRLENRSDGSREIELTQAELAQMIGVSRQTANEILKRLEEEGLIEVGFKRIRVLNPERLLDRPSAAPTGQEPWRPAADTS